MTATQQPKACLNTRKSKPPGLTELDKGLQARSIELWPSSDFYGMGFVKRRLQITHKVRGEDMNIDFAFSNLAFY